MSMSTITAYKFPDNSIQYSACPSIQTGVTNIEYNFVDGTVNNGPGSARTIYFSYQFNSTPTVILTCTNNISGGNNFGVCYWINSITTSSFTISAVNSYNNTVTVDLTFRWTAFGSPN